MGENCSIKKEMKRNVTNQKTKIWLDAPKKCNDGRPCYVKKKEFCPRIYPCHRRKGGEELPVVTKGRRKGQPLNKELKEGKRGLHFYRKRTCRCFIPGSGPVYQKNSVEMD